MTYSTYMYVIEVFYQRQPPHEILTTQQCPETLLRNSGYQPCLELWNKGLWTKFNEATGQWLYARIETVGTTTLNKTGIEVYE